MLLVVLPSHPLQIRRCQRVIRRLCTTSELLYFIRSFASVCIAYSTTKNVLYEVITLTCRGLCSQMQITGGGKYSGSAAFDDKDTTVGDHRGSLICSVYVKTDLKICPCCHLRLRLSPRATKNKHLFLSEMQIPRI
jgi:hypothetical protein